MNIKFNEFGEVVSVNGLTVGQHLGAPMQDAVAERPEDNEAYATQANTITRAENCIDDVQPTRGEEYEVVLETSDFDINEMSSASIHIISADMEKVKTKIADLQPCKALLMVREFYGDEPLNVYDIECSVDIRGSTASKITIGVRGLHFSNALKTFDILVRETEGEQEVRSVSVHRYESI